MRFALDDKGNRIEASYTNQTAFCPGCNSIVLGRKGAIKQPYWCHEKKDCDSWYKDDPITQWHLDWQNEFDKKYQEVTIVDRSSNSKHRADVKLPNGNTIEIQNSPLSSNKIIEREEFYGRNNLIWILNGSNLFKQCKLSYHLLPKKNEFSILFADYIPEFDNYDLDEFNEIFYESKVFEIVKEQKYDIKHLTSNGHYHFFIFSLPEDFSNLTSEIEHEIRNLFISLYGYKRVNHYNNHFDSQYEYRSKDVFSSVKLEKKYWPKSIDFMECPVYIDNIHGLHDDYLYHLQSNRIVHKTEFIVELKN